VLYAALIAAYVSVLFYLARKAGKEGVPEEPMLGPSTPALAKEGGEAAEGPWHPAASRSTSAFIAASVRSMTGAELQSDDPERLARRWSEVMDLPLSRDGRSRPIIALDDARLRFVTATDGRGEGLAGLDLDCADKGRVLSGARARGLAAKGDMVVACGMRFYVV